MVERNTQAPKTGMNRDTASFEVSKEYYTFALNANIQDEHGSGQVVLQNEPSNIKCSGFKAGYRVIGHKYDARTERVYFFLTNPTTNFSEIGYITVMQEADILQPNESIVNGEIQVILETPLENLPQVSTCPFITIISDNCQGSGSGCFNFSIYHPIKEANVQIKHGKRGTTMWWTDNFNPQRYLELENLEKYTTNIDPCDDEDIEICLDCNKMRVFPLFDKPCLEPALVSGGGNLRAGIYEVLIGGADEEGNILTNLYAQTNVIPIFDRNNIVLDQTLLDYQTNLAIKISVSAFDAAYDYFTLVVAYRSGLDGAATYHQLGTYNGSREEVTIDTLQGSKLISLQDILNKRPIYQKAEGITQSNGYLYQYGLTAHREVNLQPVANLLGGFARWSSYMAKETLYSEAEGVAKYKSHMRDEVYPYAIRFFFKGGYNTALFPLIARPPFEFETHEIDTEDYPLNDEINSVLQYNPECSENNRRYRWQFENTAQKTNGCLIPDYSGSEETVPIEQTTDCFVIDEDGAFVVVDSLEEGQVSLPSNTDLATFINNNREAIIAGDFNPAFSDIQAILQDPSEYEESCEPLFQGNCDNDAELVSEQIFAIGVGSQTVTGPCEVDKIENPANPNFSCSIFERDGNNALITDRDFVNTFLQAPETASLRLPVSNTNCTTAVIAPELVLPQVSNSSHILYQGQLNGQNTLLTNKIAFNTLSKIRVTLTGTSGTATLNIGPNNYSITAASDPTTTVTNFVASSEAAQILLDFPEVVSVTADGPTIVIEGAFINHYETPVVGGAGNLAGTYDNLYFSTNVHANAVWFSVPMTSLGQRLFELTALSCASQQAVDTSMLRLTVFDSCSNNTSLQGTIQQNVTTNSYVTLSETNYPNTAFIAVDTPIRVRPKDADVTSVLLSTCSCFSVYQRDTEPCFLIDFTNLTFGKRQTWKTICDFVVPTLNSNCEAVPYEKGLFSYVESTELYPCNKELYDSSVLRIRPENIPSAIQQEFEDYYTDGIDTNGFYILKPETDFRDKPIRHYKYPDNNVSPFMSDIVSQAQMQEALIFPIGFHVPDSAISAMLDVALENNLITVQERANITSYEIFRGDRRVQRSIIAKGLVYDMYKYQERNQQGPLQDIYYPNFPLNTLGRDQYHNIFHPYNSRRNRFFTFHSPETEFYRPTLGREMRVEAYMYGESLTEFDEVRNHPTYIMLGNGGYALATSLSVAEASFELALQLGNLGVLATTGGISAPLGVAAAITAAAGITLASAFRTGELRLKWIRTIKNLGKPNQFAYYQVTRGHYHQLKPNTEIAHQKLRGIATSTYLKDGRWMLVNENVGEKQSYNINNLDREYSVALHTGETYDYQYPLLYRNYDNTQGTNFGAASRRRYIGVGRSDIITGAVASPYVAMKNYLPAQYGSIDSITWLSTGFCGIVGLQDDCAAAFGGDTFISRFSLKRKVPFFRTNAFGLAPLTPFKYSDYHNINPQGAENNPDGHLFLDFEVNPDNVPPVAGYIFPSDKSDYKLYSGSGSIETPDISGMYVKPPNKFFLYAYGIPSFLVESEINCNFRYAKRERHEDFYPNVQDVVEWTQETNVSIRQPNTFFYNPVYSYTQTLSGYKLLPQNYQKNIYDRLNNLDNFVIYSRQDVSENSLFDPWLAYRPIDAYNFSQSYGRLVSMKGIESLQLVALFENGFEIFGSVDVLADRLTPETKNLGTGGIFAGRPVSFNKTDTGHQGSQHNMMLSCEAGHFWVDAKRGKVFGLQPGGKGLREISRGQQALNAGLEKWFKDQLPFKILKSFPNLDIDNNYNFVGLTMGWDDRTKRLFLTKKDYVPKRADIKYLEGIGFYITVQGQNQRISLEDKRYFTNASWTVAYSPIMDSWLSYYSFKPNYYTSFNNYFQTGINETMDNTEFGVWSHLPFQSSYQVFYGKRYPFIIEYPILTKGSNAHLQFIEYWLETRKYYNKYDYVDSVGIGFNKAYVYNTYQNTGLLELIHQQNNNPWQNLQYPAYLPDRAQVLQTEIAGRWTFNHLYNAINKENQGLPIFLNDITNTDKEIDLRLVNQNPTFKDYLRGDYFLARLINDKESRYKYLFRFGGDHRNFHTP
jgi:hypothetical protein